MEGRGLDYADSVGQSVQLLASQGGRCSVGLFSWNFTSKNGFNKSFFYPYKPPSSYILSLSIADSLLESSGNYMYHLL